MQQMICPMRSLLYFVGNSLLETPRFPNRQPESSDFERGVVFDDAFQLLYCFSAAERKPTQSTFYMYSVMTASVIYSAVYVSAGQVEKPLFISLLDCFIFTDSLSAFLPAVLILPLFITDK